MKKFFSILIFTLMGNFLLAQTNQPYQLPPPEILELVDIQPRPAVRIDSRNKYMAFFERKAFKTLDELAEDEVRLAGLRINPQTNGRSRQTVYYGLKIKLIERDTYLTISGLPTTLRIADIAFSPDESILTFTNTLADGTELWMVDLTTARALKLASNLNAASGSPYVWVPNSKALLVKQLPKQRSALAKNKVLPEGPTIQETTGQKAPARTFQDLLRNPADEAEYEYYTQAEIVKVTLDGSNSPFLPVANYQSLNFSPAGNYLLVQTIQRPYSYIVPQYRFSMSYDLYSAEGQFIRNFYLRPLLEALPSGFDAVETGKRYISWRADQPATLVWAEAQDGGDPANDQQIRDHVYQLDAPFTDTPQLLAAIPNRYAGITWGNEHIAILYDYWWKTRKTTTYKINPGEENRNLQIIYDRSSEDYYGNPGSFLTRKNQFNEQVLWISSDGKSLYLQGEGYGPEGNRPFIDRFNIKTLSTTRLWQADGKSTYESIVRIIDPEKRKMITSIESKDVNPNFYIRTASKIEPVTSFPNPYASFMNVSKERVHYTRNDGVELSATLYLPAGYDKEKDGPLPMLMWAYPREYKDAQQASQIKESPHTFVQLYYGSPIYWAARGYAIMDDADFPIIGEGEEEPNDSFVDQLVGNAAAAIDYAVERGVADRDRVAIGGHSYGAFMTANLMAHSDLFAAGIARSGAYNRSLTPFGFQAEERTFWEAPEVYLTMSPFVHADKINEPLLLIHGDADNNPGTFTLQSERLFGAIKGLGGTARLVLLPYESHGYNARENILHMLWETDTWLEKYVKNKS
ncbi:MAG: prolyl oligopeptidase family serine peptidase [Lentimicrobiaceae bacterium]|nr:prolyl oligopeptidase family serine peptidase [Lentimicrobiaceae bacterium]